MIDPTVTTPEDLAFHFSAYAARLADALEGGPQPANERGMALKHLAQGLEYARLSIVAAAPAGMADEVSHELNTLLRQVDTLVNLILKG